MTDIVYLWGLNTSVFTKGDQYYENSGLLERVWLSTGLKQDSILSKSKSRFTCKNYIFVL